MVVRVSKLAVLRGWGVQLIGLGACGAGPSGVFGVGALYIYIKINSSSWLSLLHEFFHLAQQKQ